MAEIIKTVVEIEDIFREAICLILGLDPESNHKRIRFPWSSQLDVKGIAGTSTPDWKRDEDVCFIFALPYDDAYNRQRNRRNEYRGGADLVAIDEHTNVHNMMFVNYGPGAYDYARKIRDGFFRSDLRLFLRKNHLHLITNIPAPRRVPELVNAEWWNRVDVNVMFNEFVRLECPMTTIEEVRMPTFFSGIAGANEPE